MDSIDIQYALKKKGVTQASIAKIVGVSEGVVSNTILNRATCSAVAAHVARDADVQGAVAITRWNHVEYVVMAAWFYDDIAKRLKRADELEERESEARQKREASPSAS